jgi:RNA polymerase sigma-70 factor, ECF subfamily
LLGLVLTPGAQTSGMAGLGPDPDEGLVSQSRAGDMEAFAQLIERHEGRVYALVCQYIGQEEDARDLVRDVFLKAYRSLDRFGGRSKFSSWVCRIAINRSIDHLRRKKHVRIESLDEPRDTGDGGMERDIADTAETPDAEVERRELAARIQDAIRQLSPKLREVTILREYGGLSIEEIGQTLKLSPGTVKSRIFRARERLRGLLASYIEGSE